MEETLFDIEGNAIAYVAADDGHTIYLWSGRPVAYLDEERIYGFNGIHLGWYENGVIFNLVGERNGFSKSSLPVFAKFEPFKSFKQFSPFKAFKEFAKTKPYWKSSMSKTPLSQFLSRGGK